jgi:FRG domain
VPSPGEAAPELRAAPTGLATTPAGTPSGVQEIRVGSWTELHERLFDDSWQEGLGRHRSNVAYRGRSLATEGLQTSLQRLGGEPEALEEPLLRSFRRYARRSDVPYDSTWNWLALARHHGLPTRLLDWTYSPYVALHFATSALDRYGEDGVVWTLDFVQAHELLPTPLQDVVRDEGANVFTAEMIDRVARRRSEFDHLAEDDDFVLFLEPPSFDDRIVNQYALFSLMSSGRASLDEWCVQHSDLVRRIVIPAALKWEVRDKLDQANITERVLFPGLDGLSRWLRRYYLPRSG